MAWVSGALRFGVEARRAGITAGGCVGPTGLYGIRPAAFPGSGQFDGDRSGLSRQRDICDLSLLAFADGDTVLAQEAAHGERVLPGHAYIAPGDMHLSLGRSGANYVTELDQGPPVNRHRPAVDVLFRSAARNAGANALGVILTGMGKDGAVGMLEMRNAGAYNVAQDEASCVVYGMPKEAVAHGGVHEVLPLSQIGPHVLAKLSAHGRVTRV